jgi:hypothetical protein
MLLPFVVHVRGAPMWFVKEIGLYQRREPRQPGGVSDLPWDDVQYFFDLDEMGTLPDVRKRVGLQ